MFAFSGWSIVGVRVALTPNIEGVWSVLPSRVELPKVEGCVVPLVVPGFLNEFPPFKPGGLLVLGLSQGATLKQYPRLGKCYGGSGRSEVSGARRGGLLAKNTTAKWILVNGSEQSCRLPPTECRSVAAG